MRPRPSLMIPKLFLIWPICSVLSRMITSIILIWSNCLISSSRQKQTTMLKWPKIGPGFSLLVKCNNPKRKSIVLSGTLSNKHKNFRLQVFLLAKVLANWSKGKSIKSHKKKVLSNADSGARSWDHSETTTLFKATVQLLNSTPISP